MPGPGKICLGPGKILVLVLYLEDATILRCAINHKFRADMKRTYRWVLKDGICGLRSDLKVYILKIIHGGCMHRSCSKYVLCTVTH